MGHLLRCTLRTNRLDSAVTPVVESLEQRQLLSVSLHNGILAIEGTDAAESITILPSPRFAGKLQVNVNKQKQFFDEADVKGIYIDANAGNDRVVIENIGKRITIPCTIHGGPGNDTLGGGFGKDIIDGGSGDDLISGGGGGSILVGGPGNDRIMGGDGADTIYGGRGRNQISTSPKAVVGKDKVIPGGGQDTINRQFQPNFPTETWTGTPTAYTPFQMRRAYGFGDLADKNYTNRGKGQAIAIIDAFHTPTAKRDLNAFSKQFGLPAPTSKTFWQVYASGSKPTEDENWSGEALLDIEWAHAIAPEATIILVEADSPLHADVSSAIDTGVKLLNRHFGGGVVSLSLGFAENSSQLALDGTFSNAYTKNISFVAAAGDTPQPSWPATNPNVLSVGGTTLFLDDYGTRRGGNNPSATLDPISLEPRWWWDGEDPVVGDRMDNQVPGGEAWWIFGGGGPSAFYPEPTYQQNRLVNYYTSIGQTTAMRGTADLAWAADPTPDFGGVNVFSTAGNGGFAGWFSFGGTSCGAPQVAAMVALANQVRAQNKLGKIGNTLLDRIYRLGSRGGDQYFNDITQRFRLPQPAPFWVAGSWDYATGWGSPNARTLIPALADQKTLPNYVNKPLKLSGQLTTYNPIATGGVAAAVTNLQFKGTGTAQGVRTIAIQTTVNKVYTQSAAGVTQTTAPTVSLFGYITAFYPGAGPMWDVFSNPGFGTRDPGLSIILHRDGDTLTGVANWEIRSGTGTAVAIARGYIKFVGKMDNKGKISGEFFSITPDGKKFTNIFTVDPLRPTFPVTMVKGKFST